jgi:hypothetical protein
LIIFLATEKGSTKGCVIIVHGKAGSDELGVLVRFRQAFYDCLDRRGDALFELTDAVVARPDRVDSLPALSLEPEFRRGHGALYGALSRGRVEVARLRTLLLGTVALGDNDVLWFAGDVSNIARPDAMTSPERLAVHDKSARTTTGKPVTSGYPYAVMAALEPGPTSWTAPVDVVRLRPDDTLTQITLDAMTRIIDGLTTAGRTGERGQAPGFVFDSEYDLMALSHELGATTHILGRLRSNQTFHAAPAPTCGPRGRGAPARHGTKIKLNDPATLTAPDRTAVTTTARYGRVTLSAWDNQHRRITRAGYWEKHPGRLPIVTGTVIRIQIERLPGGGAPHRPMWLWHAGPVSLNLVTLFATYQRRFDIEHTFRFLKQDLGWTVFTPMLPSTGDLWTWLVLVAYTQLRLSRKISRDLRMSWEKPQAPDRITPRRVRRDIRRVHHHTGTPSNPPKNTRPGPGRPQGSKKPPRERHHTHLKSRTKSKKPTKAQPKG